MRKRYEWQATAAAVAGIAALVTACGQLDVVSKDSARAFGDMLDAAYPTLTVQDELTGAYALSSPDGQAHFLWAADFAFGAGDAATADSDLVLRLEAEPFIDAGLDVDKLPDTITFWNAALSLGVNLGDALPSTASSIAIDGSKAAALASYEQLVKLHRERIGYHTALDHYNIDLGNGNMFEWAKDLGANDKDIVFVLNPAPFIAAGVDPTRIAGWVYTTVPAEDANGRAIEVEKILKAINLR